MAIGLGSQVHWCCNHGHMQNSSCLVFLFLTSAAEPQLNGFTLQRSVLLNQKRQEP